MTPSERADLWRKKVHDFIIARSKRINDDYGRSVYQGSRAALDAYTDLQGMFFTALREFEQQPDIVDKYAAAVTSLLAGAYDDDL